REPLRRIVGYAVECQPVVTAASIRDDLHRSSAERICESTCLRLHVGARRHTGGQCGKYERISSDVRKVGNFFRTHRRSEIRRSCVQQFQIGGHHNLFPHCSNLQGKICPRVSSGGQNKARLRLRAETRDLDLQFIGVGGQKRNGIFSRAVGLGRRREVG